MAALTCLSLDELLICLFIDLASFDSLNSVYFKNGLIGS